MLDKFRLQITVRKSPSGFPMFHVRKSLDSLSKLFKIMSHFSGKQTHAICELNVPNVCVLYEHTKIHICVHTHNLLGLKYVLSCGQRHDKQM